MNPADESVFAGLREVFNVEAAEHVQAIGDGLLALEQAATPAERQAQVAIVFRAAHSLKGAAQAVGLADIESQCHALEDLFSGWKRNHGSATPDALDAAHRAVSAISAGLTAPTPAPAPTSTPTVAPTQSRVPVKAARRQSAPADTTNERGGHAADDTVRIAVAKLDAMLVLAEEMFAAKLAVAQRAEDLRELSRGFETWTNEWLSVEPEARAVRQALSRPETGAAESRRAATHGTAVTRLLDFGDWTADYIKALERQVLVLERRAQRDRHLVGRVVDDFLADAKRLVLLPFSICAAPFPKLVRDLSREQGKEVDLVIRGDDVTVDKRILDEIKDPLVHLLRNAVDHGVESPDARVRAGKPRQATITLAAEPVNGRKVKITVTDDGRGLDLGQVREAAVRHGVVSRDAARTLDDTEAQALAFHPGVSTSREVSKVSGRGLGLAIVRERADKLGGTVTVESVPGSGTEFHILVPLMLSTVRGILIDAADRRFVVPTAHVERVARVKADDVRTVEGRETVALDGTAIAFARLADVLDLPAPDREGVPPGATPVIVVVADGQRVALAVDAVFDEQEVLVKRLRRPLVRVRNVSGAAVLASGQVVPILNATDILRSTRQGARTAPRPAATPRPVGPATKSILVAEDSITSRMMLKIILEGAGYRVQTAVDGMDALTQLRSGSFDLLVSDVEMPRLHGFDLTARIRADRKLAELPVVLVTAMETREDRERGIDVGANAYLVKSGFDQADLLDTIRRLT